MGLPLFHAKSPAYRLQENSTYRFIDLKAGNYHLFKLKLARAFQCDRAVESAHLFTFFFSRWFICSLAWFEAGVSDAWPDTAGAEH